MTAKQNSSISFIEVPDLAPPPGYSNAVSVDRGRLVFIAGQAAYDANGALVGIGDFDAQVGQVFRNLEIALRAAGCSPGDLVKMTVFLRDMDQLPAYRAVRDGFFAISTPPAKPAVTLVEVSKLFDADLLIEIEAIAAR